MSKNNKAFTLVELIAVLVILSIIVLISVPLIITIKNKAKLNAYKRSIDAYGKAIEIEIASNLIDKGTIPTDLSTLKIEYTGYKVSCNVMQIKENGGIYLSECTVNGKEIKDKKTEDGWYHYNKRDLTNEEYVELYGDALQTASIAYLEKNGSIVSDYTSLTLNYIGKKVLCDVIINYDGTIYMTKCKVNNIDVINEAEEDGFYHYGDIVNPTAIQSLLLKANKKNITTYSAGNQSEMYTLSHPATIQTGAFKDFRYIGAFPNNYVYFNGNELWRILGIFKVEDENGNKEERIKIIKNEKLSTNLAWNSNDVNDWVNSSINSYLNGDYYNGFDVTCKNMIADTKYYLGGSNTHSGGAETYYVWERGTTVYSGRSKNFIGKISLMYLSDFYGSYALGVDDMCYTNSFNCNENGGGTPTNSWIYNTNSYSSQWTISPYSNNNIFAFSIEAAGTIKDYNNDNRVVNANGIRPVLYLKSDIKIISGDGTEQNPYQLSL